MSAWGSTRPPRRLAAATLIACVSLTATALMPAQASASPTLAQLPQALVASSGTRLPLTVVLPPHPSSAALRAAIVAASAAQKVAGFPGLDVRVLVSASPTHVVAGPGADIVIDSRAGSPRLALDTARGGSPRLTISGSGSGLVAAARLLWSPVLKSITGTSASVPVSFAQQLTHSPSSSSVPVEPAQVTGRGKLTMTTSFTLPVDRQLVGTTPLRLVTAYTSGAGGRETISLAGSLLGAVTVPGNGQVGKVTTVKLSDTSTLSNGTLPGWLLHPGRNELTVTATPSRDGASGTLQVGNGSQLTLHSQPRTPALQLALWPFPIYDAGAWSHATVVLGPHPDTNTLAELIGALSNTSRITGLPADPNVTLGAPTRAQAKRNLIFVGSAATAATHGQFRGLGRLPATQPSRPNVLEEVKVPGGGVGLLAYGARALAVLGRGYQVGSVPGRSVLVDVAGRPHTLAAGESVPLFAQPRWPWLAPTAFLAVLALGWIAVKALRTRRRLASMPAFDPSGGGAS